MKGIKAFSSLKEQIGGRVGRDGRVDSFLCCVAMWERDAIDTVRDADIREMGWFGKILQ